MCEWGEEIIVNLPDHINSDRDERTVSIDSCIVDQIQDLWLAGVTTLGCCCGHGKSAPSVIIDSGYSPLETARAFSVLSADRERHWIIHQWRLIAVAEKPAMIKDVSRIIEPAKGDTP